MHKKIIVSAGAIALVYSLAFGITVFAEDQHGDVRMEKNETKSMMHPLQNLLQKIEKFDAKEFSIEGKPVREVPSTVTINPHGNTRLTNGKVIAVSGDIVTVEIWKLNFSVHKMPETRVFASNDKEFVFSDIAVGDMVDVMGQLDTTTPAFLHAQAIHDRTKTIKAQQEESGRLQGLINELIRKLNDLLAKAGKQQLPTPTPLFNTTPSPSATPSPSQSALPSPSSSPSQSPSPSSSPMY